jgi:hypothetical protein
MRTINLNEMPTLKNIDTKSVNHSHTQFQPPAINSPNSSQGLGGLLDEMEKVVGLNADIKNLNIELKRNSCSHQAETNFGQSLTLRSLQ